MSGARTCSPGCARTRAGASRAPRPRRAVLPRRGRRGAQMPGSAAPCFAASGCAASGFAPPSAGPTSLPQPLGLPWPDGPGARLILHSRRAASTALEAPGSVGASTPWLRTQAITSLTSGPSAPPAGLGGCLSSHAALAAFTVSGSEASFAPSHCLSATGSAGAPASPWLRRHATNVLKLAGAGSACRRGVFEPAPRAGRETAAIAATADAAATARVIVNLLMLSLLGRWASRVHQPRVIALRRGDEDPRKTAARGPRLRDTGAREHPDRPARRGRARDRRVAHRLPGGRGFRRRGRRRCACRDRCARAPRGGLRPAGRHAAGRLGLRRVPPDPRALGRSAAVPQRPRRGRRQAARARPGGRRLHRQVGHAGRGGGAREGGAAPQRQRALDEPAPLRSPRGRPRGARDPRGRAPSRAHGARVRAAEAVRHPSAPGAQPRADLRARVGLVGRPQRRLGVRAQAARQARGRSPPPPAAGDRVGRRLSLRPAGGLMRRPLSLHVWLAFALALAMAFPALAGLAAWAVAGSWQAGREAHRQDQAVAVLRTARLDTRAHRDAVLHGLAALGVEAQLGPTSADTKIADATDRKVADANDPKGAGATRPESAGASDPTGGGAR